MRKTRQFLLLTLGIVFFFSCEKQVPVSPSPQKPSSDLRKITLTAIFPTLTKSALQDGEKVLWTPGDKISVFYGSSQAEFTSTNAEPVSTAEFTGYIEAPSDISNEQLSLYGVYPYSSTNQLSEGVVTVSLPAEQPAVVGTFADDLSISVGRSTGTAMTFYNVCGLVELSVSREDVTKVTLSGLGDELLAGTLSVSIGSDGIPSVAGVTDGSTSVSVSAPEGEYLTPGAAYYLVVAPTVLSQGVKVGVETDEALMIKRIEKPLEVKRSVVSVLSGVDEGALPEFVPFADAAFKAYCVENFDTDGDGEISLAEAETVTQISCTDMGISSLGGIKYFPNLTVLECSNNDQIGVLDVSHLHSLRILLCGNTGLTTLDVTNNPDLVELDCAVNDLVALDVSGNSCLESLTVYSCSLHSLDLSGNPALRIIQADFNALEVLDVSNNPALTDLHCAGNQLTSLDVSGLSELNELHCDKNQLSVIDVSRNENLEVLNCSDNPISTLDISETPMLRDLACSGNQLSVLDVSNNPYLTYLCCENNALENLDLSNNPLLQSLRAESNPLEYIYVSVGQSMEVIEIPEGAQLIQKASNSTENFTREEW